MDCDLIDKGRCPASTKTEPFICPAQKIDNPVYLYIILCDNGNFYTGFTRNIDQRMEEHKTGRGSAYCRLHKPIHYCKIPCLDASKGLVVEKRIKSKTHDQKKVVLEKYGIIDVD